MRPLEGQVQTAKAEQAEKNEPFIFFYSFLQLPNPSSRCRNTALIESKVGICTAIAPSRGRTETSESDAWLARMLQQEF